VRDDNVFHFMAVEEGFDFAEMHIELLATFRGLSGPEGVVEAKNLGARLIGGPIDSLC
jgi:hypothetical protein